MLDHNSPVDESARDGACLRSHAVGIGRKRSTHTDPLSTDQKRKGMKIMKSAGGVRMVVLGLALATGILTPLTPVYSQTQGQERRDDRQDARDTRQTGRKDARDKKADCKAGDEKSRAECRQEKRDTKQDARDAARDIKRQEANELLDALIRRVEQLDGQARRVSISLGQRP